MCALLRLCQANVLWIEEAYGMAAAGQIWRGLTLYRDIWFDKPPLYAFTYLLVGTADGVPLRILGALFILFTAWLAWKIANPWAAVFIAWFLTFGIPSAVMALAPDLLFVPLHLASIGAARANRPLLSGLCSGLGFWCNTKSLVILPVCFLWQSQIKAASLLSAAFLSVVAIGVAWLAAASALTDWWQQVWITGWFYSRDTFLTDPWLEAAKRTLNWAGFHAGLLIPGGCYVWKRRDWRIATWTAAALLTVFVGWRFFPRYYFAMLPPLALAASFGFVHSGRIVRTLTLLLLLIPAVRFAPAYLRTLQGQPWSDTALADDSRKAAEILLQSLGKSDFPTLFVWGYRPDVYVFTQFPAATPFLDSQPVSGVFADRHLFTSRRSLPADQTSANVQRLLQTKPSFIVDGLGLLNADLALGRQPELTGWLANYVEFARTETCILYSRR